MKETLCVPWCGEWSHSEKMLSKQFFPQGSCTSAITWNVYFNDICSDTEAKSRAYAEDVLQIHLCRGVTATNTVIRIQTRTLQSIASGAEMASHLAPDHDSSVLNSRRRPKMQSNGGNPTRILLAGRRKIHLQDVSQHSRVE
ncbi:hypothetical protein GWK47_036411 [Chionoecetes opilio]|uniref:Uncharacterized protein n=1 Tax=Chionoecetes opilio TaxID=41210 RepID=A0A8J4YFV1_CHIOP|nr:hypothetical protein GWK47_036411 [Chionoecetes opilio]